MDQTGEAERELVAREVEPERGARAETVVLAEVELDEARTQARRLAGDQPHGTADRVAPLHRALRTAQHLDLFEVEHAEVGAGERRVIDVVDVHPDPRLQREVEVVLADAADVGVERGAVGERRRAQLHVGRTLGRLVDRLRATCAQCLAGQRGDRDRRVLERLLAEPGRHRDLFGQRALGIVRTVRGLIRRRIRAVRRRLAWSLVPLRRR